MANKDNILAGFAGAVEGARDILVPWMQGKIASDQKEEYLRRTLPFQQEQELGQYGKKLKLQEESQRRTLPFETDEKIRFEKAKETKKQQKTTMLKSEAIRRLKAGEKLGEVDLIDDEKLDPETKKEQNKKTAIKKTTDYLSEMKSVYDSLDEMGAIVNTEKGSIENIMARTRASSAGQATGEFFGTKAQSLRNRINSIRPLLIQEFRQATQMGARGMDSEKELEFYLQASTDPKRDYQSNLAALAVLDSRFGTGELAKQIDNKYINSLEKEWESKKQTGEYGKTVDDFLKNNEGAEFVGWEE